jgi:hypothetical protein
MANEITLTTGIQILKANLVGGVDQRTYQVDMAGTRFIRNVQAVGTTYEAIVTGDLASAGWASFRNLDATNYIEIGLEVSAAFQSFIRINAGQTVGPFRLATLSIFGRANTAAVNLDVFISEA